MMFDYTKEEKEHIINTYFQSKDPLILKQFPAKEKKKYVILLCIKDVFLEDVIYTEKEINALLKPIYHDYVMIRRYLVDYQFLNRNPEGSMYIKNQS